MLKFRTFLSFPVLTTSSFRLALVYLLLFGISVVVLTGFMYGSTAGYMAGQTDQTIDAEITGLSERYRLSGLPGLTDAIAGRVSREREGVSVYLLTDRRFIPLLGNLRQWPDAQASEDGWLEFPLGYTVTGTTRIGRAKHFRLRGGFHLLVGRDISELNQLQSLLARAVGGGIIITLALGLAGGLLMSRSLLRRVDGINTICGQIMAGDLAKRVPVGNGNDELQQLASNLNNMMDRIQTLMDGVRHVSDNIAHDLKTPLARLRHRLEELQQQIRRASLSSVEVEAALAETDGMLETFNALLRISRIETMCDRNSFKPIVINQLVDDVFELYQPLIEQRGISLLWQAAENCSLFGDKDLLFQLFANLIDNAVKFTPQDGRITVGCRAYKQSVEVRIADNGPGIGQTNIKRVFERFQRLDNSRNTPGNGLGLSLVQAVVTLHDAAIELSDNQPGLCVELKFPLYESTHNSRRAISFDTTSNASPLGEFAGTDAPWEL